MSLLIYLLACGSLMPTDTRVHLTSTPLVVDGAVQFNRFTDPENGVICYYDQAVTRAISCVMPTSKP